MAPIELTESQLLEALEAAMALPGDDQRALATSELVERWGVGECTVRRRLRLLVKAGKVASTWKVIQDMHGRRCRVPAFKLAE